MSLKELCENQNISLEDAIMKLESADYKVTPESNIKEISSQKSQLPSAIYEIIK